jgi:hypothetical protein
LLERLLYILDNDVVRVGRAQLQELSEVRVVSLLLADAFLLKEPEEVFGLHDVKSLLFCLAPHVLLEYDIGKEFGGAHVLLEQVEHEHNHDLD